MRLFPQACCDRCGLPGNHPACPHPVGVFNKPKLKRGKWYQLKASPWPVYIAGLLHVYSNWHAIEGEPSHWHGYDVVYFDGSECTESEAWLVSQLETDAKGKPKQVRRPKAWTSDPFVSHQTTYSGPPPASR